MASLLLLCLGLVYLSTVECAVTCERWGNGNFECTGEDFVLQVLGNQNQPRYRFAPVNGTSENQTKPEYSFGFTHFRQYTDIDDHNGLPGTNVALNSLSWAFSDPTEPAPVENSTESHSDFPNVTTVSNYTVTTEDDSYHYQSEIYNETTVSRTEYYFFTSTNSSLDFNITCTGGGEEIFNFLNFPNHLIDWRNNWTNYTVDKIETYIINTTTVTPKCGKCPPEFCNPPTCNPDGPALWTCTSGGAARGCTADAGFWPTRPDCDSCCDARTCSELNSENFVGVANDSENWHEVRVIVTHSTTTFERNTTNTTLAGGIHVKFDIVLEGFQWSEDASEPALGLRFTFKDSESGPPTANSSGVYFPEGRAYVDVGDDETNSVHAVIRTQGEGDSSNFWLMIPHFGDLYYDPNVAVSSSEFTQETISGNPVTASASTEENHSLIPGGPKSSWTAVIVSCTVIGVFVAVAGVVGFFKFSGRKSMEQAPLVAHH